MPNTMQVGSNVSVIRTYTTLQPFLNIVKTADAWYSTIAESTFYTGLDSDGYPTTLSGSTYGQLKLLNGIPSANVPTGRYVLLYDGTDGASPITILGDGSKNVSESVAGRIMIDMPTYAGNGIQVQINSIGSPHVHNMRLVYSPDSTGAGAGNTIGVREALLNAGEIFDPFFTTRDGPYRIIRFLDPLGILQNFNVNWSDRPTLNWFSWNDGLKFNSTVGLGGGIIPFEVAISMCNKFNADLWLNIPILATDDFVTQLANLVLSTLNSNLNVIVEYGNEMWNFNFASGMVPAIVTMAQGYYPGLSPSFACQIFGGNLRQVLTGQLFKSVWSNSPRVKSVLGIQSGDDGIWTPLLAHDGLSSVYPVVTVVGGNPTTVTFTPSWPTTTSSPTGLVAGLPIAFSSGTLPSGMSLSTTYYVMAAGLNMAGGSFQISASPGGPALSSGAGTFTGVQSAYWAGLAGQIFDGIAGAPYFPSAGTYPVAWSNSSLGYTKAFAQFNSGVLPAAAGTTTGGTSTAYTLSTGPVTPSDCDLVNMVLHVDTGNSPTLKTGGGGGTAYPLIKDWNTPIVAGQFGPGDGFSSGNWAAVFNGTLSVWEITLIYNSNNGGWQYDPQGDLHQVLGWLQNNYNDGPATYPNLSLYSYEGGQNFNDNNNADFKNFYTTLFQDSRMEGVFTSLLTQMQSIGVKSFCHYSDMGAWGNTFYWGALPDQWGTGYATSPRYDALMDFIGVGDGTVGDTTLTIGHGNSYGVYKSRPIKIPH